MEFYKLRAEDRNTINGIIGDNPERICENTFGTMYIWSVHDEYSYHIEDKTLYFGVIDEHFAEFYYPIGPADDSTKLGKLTAFCKEKGLELRFSFLSGKQVEIILKYLGDNINIIEDRNWAEYLYSYEDLLYLKGKKYHGQRNHINRFLREYPASEFLPYDEKMHDEMLIFLKEHYESLEKDNQWLRDERYVIENKLLPQYSLLGQTGLIVKVDGKIIAAAFGEILGDTLYVHFEKALREYNGSYAIINQRFAEFCYIDGLKYINREEDLGDLGLRTAKLSLHPVEIVPKFSAKVDI